ncbi:hypothetical protein CJF32_00002413 [Rutstroemia sp. NJR-2017a WRK4]|nr:hypothetical protein CJF32_00002146 [Rutstroemia sp. NJR-2017a WRK4]PQE14884.1 hypothetical protein CJF32_00002413 [Rutstroemia sp. NJR-2017a WRK4]
MYISLLSVVSLCAVVLAGPNLERRQDTSAIQASLSRISASLAPPPSIAAQLTGIPSSVQALQTNPSGINQLISQFATGTPSWFAALPSAAQSYVLSNGLARLSAYPVISSLQAQLTSKPIVPTGATNSTTNGSSGLKTTSVTSGGGNSTVTTKPLTSTATTGSQTTSAKGNSSATTSGAKPSSTASKAAAAQATGAIAFGLAGAAGFVGIVMAL